MCTSPGTTGYTVKSISLERAHFKADVVCDEENGALAFEYEEISPVNIFIQFYISQSRFIMVLVLVIDA